MFLQIFYEATLCSKDIKMTSISSKPDYTGIHPDYRESNEERSLTGYVNAVVIPFKGAFFAEGFSIRLAVSGRVLQHGLDYTFAELDVLATKATGKEVFNVVVFKGVLDALVLDYQFVGGSYMHGGHLIAEARRIYPDGITSAVHWDKILNKPNTFPVAPHMTHTSDTYGYDGAVDSMKRAAAAIVRPVADRMSPVTNIVDQGMNTIRARLEAFRVEEAANIEALGLELRVQPGEYVYTDGQAAANLTYGYGTWSRVLDQFLTGGSNDPTSLISDAYLINEGMALGSRGVNVWQLNNPSATKVNYTLSATAHAGLSAGQYNEDQDIVVRIQTTGVPTGTVLYWNLWDTTDKTPPSTIIEQSVGIFTIAADGSATTTLRFKTDATTPTSNRNYKFNLVGNKTNNLNLLVIDKSAEKRITIAFYLDRQLTKPALVLTKDSQVYLAVRSFGHATNDVCYLDWSLSTVDPLNIAEALPTEVIVNAERLMIYPLTIADNNELTGDLYLTVYQVEERGGLILNTAPNAMVLVFDSTARPTVHIEFVNNGNLPIQTLNEEAEFGLMITTSSLMFPITLEYQATMSTNFLVLPYTYLNPEDSVTILRGFASTSDFANNGANALTAIAKVGGIEVGRNTLYINDNGTSTSFSTSYSATPNGSVITTARENSTLWLNITSAGWNETIGSPLLNLQFKLYGQDVTLAQLAERMEFPFAAVGNSISVPFGPSSVDGVSWLNGNTLSIRFRVLANEKFDGNTFFESRYNIAATPGNIFSRGIELLDTSVGTVQGFFSSSPTSLVPITQVNEVDNGVPVRCYLFMYWDWNTTATRSLRLESNSVRNSDFTTAFPITENFSPGVVLRILTVDVAADQILDGDKLINVKGYGSINGVDTLLMDTAVTIIDNSISAGFTAYLTDDPGGAEVPPANGAFSERNPLQLAITIPPMTMDTRVSYEITPSGVLGSASGSALFNPGVTRAFFDLRPIADKTTDGDTQFEVKLRHTRVSDGLLISPELILRATLRDDSTSVVLDLKFYSDAARTRTRTVFGETDTIYGRASVTNLAPNSYAFLRVPQATTITETDRILIGANDPMITFADRNRVIAVRGASAGSNVVKDFVIQLNPDFKTAPLQQNLNIDLVAGRNFSNYVMNGVVSTVGVTDEPYSRTLLISDTSRTPEFTPTVPTSVNEGTAFSISLRVLNGTIGDTATVNTNGASWPLSQFTDHDFEEVRVVSSADQTFTWNFIVKADRLTTGARTLPITISTSKSLWSRQFNITVNDTSKTPNYSVVVRSNNVVVTSLDEGDTLGRLTIRNIADLLVDEKIIITRVGGRPANMIGGNPFGVEHALISSGGVIGADIPFWPTADDAITAASSLYIDLSIETTISKVVRTLRVNFNDTSIGRKFETVEWIDKATSQVITAVREGQDVYIRAKLVRVTADTRVVVENIDGRTSNDVSSYGQSFTPNLTTRIVLIPFKPTIDNIKDVTPRESAYRVRLTADADTRMAVDTSLPITNSGDAALVGIQMYLIDDPDMVPQVSLKENTPYKAVAFLASELADDNYFLNYDRNPHYNAVTKEASARRSATGVVRIESGVIFLSDIRATIAAHLSYTITVSRGQSLNGTPTGTNWTRTYLIADDQKPMLDLVVGEPGFAQYPLDEMYSGRTVHLSLVNDAIAGLGTINWDHGTDHVVLWEIMNGDTTTPLNASSEFTSGVITRDSVVVDAATGIVTFAKINLGYNPPSELPVRIRITERYDLNGERHHIVIGTSQILTYKRYTASPTILAMYWSLDYHGLQRINDVMEGHVAYLQIKTMNYSVGPITIEPAVGNQIVPADVYVGPRSNITLGVQQVQVQNNRFVGTLHLIQEVSLGT